MFKDEYKAVCNGGAGKVNLLKKNPLGYFVSAMVAGMFISFGSFVAFTLGSVINGGNLASLTKFFQAFAFASALSLVVMAGAELFTGNNFVMAAAAIRKTVTWGDTVKLWVICWIGNLVGSVISVAAFHLTGIDAGAVGEYFVSVSAGKVGLAPVPLLMRAILCNILVCLAVWCGTKLKSESGKLIMIFWCIFIFMVCGFEHSIANMSILGVGVAQGGVTIGQYFYSVLLATVGNMIGGVIFTALPYHLISKEK